MMDNDKTVVEVQHREEQITRDLLFKMIADISYLPFKFESVLRTAVFEKKYNVSKWRNQEDLTMLHAIVIGNRPPYLLPLFRAGIWKDIHRQIINLEHVHVGRTADEIAATLRMRKIQKDLDTYSIWEKSMNLLHIAARAGNLEEAKRLLAFSNELHLELDHMDCNSLYWACISGNIELFNLLRRMGVDYKQINKRRETLLHAVCMMGHSHMIEVLVRDCNMELTVKDMAKKTPLLRIAENGDIKSMKILIGCGLRVELISGTLAIAGHYGKLEYIKSMTNTYKIDIQSKDEVGKTALLRAAEQNRLDVVKYIIGRNNVDTTDTDDRKRNILHVACDGSNLETVELIIEELKKRDEETLKQLINAKDKYIGGELCMLIRGKDKGRDSWHHVEVNRDLVSIFLKVTRGGTIDVAKYGKLLDSGWGTDPDEASTKKIEQIFQSRRNPNITGNDDMTPLHIACFKEKPDVVNLLLNNCADPNTRDKFGLTPLHIASMRGNLPIVRRLLEGGAELDRLSQLVETAAEVAIKNEHKHIANYLESYRNIPVAEKFVNEVLPLVMTTLGSDTLRQLQDNGDDIRVHIVNTLRDLTVSINEALMTLGSGPVAEESHHR
jgi:ankyrin repeat protein